MTLEWRKTYPTIAAISDASLETLCAWFDNLPMPQTDVQRTVMRRLKARREDMMAIQVRDKAPHIADKLNDIIDRLERIGIKRQ